MLLIAVCGVYRGGGAAGPVRLLVPEERVRARVKISYRGSNTGWFDVEVPPRAFIDLPKVFLRDVKVEGDENLSLGHIVEIEPA